MAGSRIVSVELYGVPEIAQSADYAGYVTNAAGADLLDRIRRQSVLYDATARVEILIGESALRSRACPRPVMRGQNARLAALTELRHVRLGVLPRHVDLPTITLHGYTIVDDTVLATIDQSVITVADAGGVAVYERLTKTLWTSAIQGDQARALLRKAAR
ncbi:Scr1 family TA system antitoxin-like transcriptional regulator [Actinokineospora sp. HUAS TT18]|uniref:Scr1 family TA system antitoxin-like transcriptional regulator n=1 Tax=Actinokineospora sp. HUAS TT18 TaxID=3447451 RepID=UPI003F5272AF